MVGTIVKCYLYVNDIVAREYAGKHCALDTLVDRRNIFLRNGAADNGVDKLVTLCRVRLNPNLNMAVLALTAGLPCVFLVDVGIAAGLSLCMQPAVYRCLPQP